MLLARGRPSGAGPRERPRARPRSARGWRRPGRARPIVPGERIHVVGAQGAGASAAALLAAWAGADVDGCDPGGPSQYTPALDAVGDRRRPAPRRGARHAARRRPDRLAVTKALTAIDPDNPELAAARAAGHPARAVAAGRRRRRRRPRC